MASSGLTVADLLTLPELTAALALAKPVPVVGTPSPVQSLTSYVEVYGGGRNVATIMAELGYNPLLADRVDQHAQTMPSEAVDRLARFLERPRAEVVWACGGRELRAQAAGIGRKLS